MMTDTIEAIMYIKTYLCYLTKILLSEKKSRIFQFKEFFSCGCNPPWLPQVYSARKKTYIVIPF